MNDADDLKAVGSRIGIVRSAQSGRPSSDLF